LVLLLQRAQNAATGEKTFAILQQRLGTNYHYAGVGEVVGL
jgi:hypothetical protein